MKRIITILFLINLVTRVFAQPPVANFVFLDDRVRTVCLSSQSLLSNVVELVNASDTSRIYRYVWDYGDKSKKDTTYSISSNAKHTYTQDGKYTITLSIIDTSGIVLNQKTGKIIKIYRPTIAADFTFKADDFQTYNLTFTNPVFNPFDKTAWTYDWDFGDGTTETTDSSSIYHHFTDANSTPGYTVKLKIQLKDEVKLSSGTPAECFAVDSVVVSVTDGFFKTDSSSKKIPLIPNIFTPNKDGVNDDIVLSESDTTTMNAISGNDIFVFKTNGEQTFKFWVYNRWGQLVYKTENKTITWNGKSSSGDDLNSGVYYYVVESNAPDKRHKTAGVIHLFRE